MLELVLGKNSLLNHTQSVMQQIQLPLFDTTSYQAEKSIPINYTPNFLGADDADRLFFYCQQKLAWQHNKIRIMQRWLPLPRLECMYGDRNVSYVYSNSVRLQASPWTPQLLTLKRQVEGITGYKYNVVIGNFYRSGEDYLGWHSDDEASMGANPAIASLSLGAERKFQIRRKPKGDIQNIQLHHGSLLMMKPGFQEKYLHQLPKAKTPDVRITRSTTGYGES